MTLLALASLGGVLVGLLTAVHFVICLFLIAVVLLQSGRAGDLASAFGGGQSQANLAAMSSENILTRATKVSAFTFMVTSLLLALFAHGQATSVLDAVPEDGPAATAPAATAPVEPATTPVEPAGATGEPAGVPTEVPAEPTGSPAGSPIPVVPAGEESSADGAAPPDDEAAGADEGAMPVEGEETDEGG